MSGNNEAIVINSEMLAFLKSIAKALYSSDFTENLGQYRNELFYREAKALIAKADALSSPKETNE